MTALAGFCISKRPNGGIPQDSGANIHSTLHNTRDVTSPAVILFTTSNLRIHLIWAQPEGGESDISATKIINS